MKVAMKEKFLVNSCQKGKEKHSEEAENIEETNIIGFTRIVESMIL